MNESCVLERAPGWIAWVFGLVLSMDATGGLAGASVQPVDLAVDDPSGAAEMTWLLVPVTVICALLAGYGWFRNRRLRHQLVEQANARLRFRQSEIWRNLLMENLPLGLVEYNIEGTIVNFNERFRSLAGYDLENLEGRPVTDLIPSLESVLPRLTGVVEMDRTLRTPQGEDVWVRLQISPLAEASAQVHGGLILATDITEQKGHEQEQEKQQLDLSRIAAEWEATFDEVESPIIILDRRNLVRRVNRSAMAISGRPYQEIVGRPIEAISSEEPWRSFRNLVRQVRRGHGSVSMELTDLSENGRSWELTATPIRRPMEGAAVILIARDTTTLMALRQSLQRNELMSAMGALVAGVAHEVRNPLFGISATLDAFEARLGPEHHHHRFIKVLRTEVDRMGNLMTELLDYGKPLELQPSLQPLRGVVLEAVEHCETLIRQAGISVRVMGAQDLPMIPMDRSHMIQVFKNLVANAVQHSPSQGMVRVDLAAGENGQQIFTIRDQGPGFSQQGLPKIFEPFFSERRGGVGLGLSIVQRFVMEQGGTVRAFNHDHGGAVVEVVLPDPSRTSADDLPVADPPLAATTPTDQRSV